MAACPTCPQLARPLRAKRAGKREGEGALEKTGPRTKREKGKAGVVDLESADEFVVHENMQHLVGVEAVDDHQILDAVHTSWKTRQVRNQPSWRKNCT